ncbi:MAG: Dabb family protein [Bacteroidota bacterium]
MNLTNTFLIKLLFIFLVVTACQETQEAAPQEAETTTSMNESQVTEKLLRHVVIFKFNDDSSEEDVNRLNESFNALQDAIPVIKDFEWGINDSPEDFHQDFTHCYLLTFASEEDRDSIYTPHPAHQAFVASLQPHLEKVFVVDYWTNP